MVRNQETEVSQLEKGDCFYKLGDKAKTVYALVGSDRLQVVGHHAVERFFICPSEFYQKQFEAQKTIITKEDTRVVFLRKTLKQK